MGRAEGLADSPPEEVRDDKTAPPDNTGPPARAAMGGPRPNRPWAFQLRREGSEKTGCGLPEDPYWAGSEALNVMGHARHLGGPPRTSLRSRRSLVEPALSRSWRHGD